MRWLYRGVQSEVDIATINMPYLGEKQLLASIWNKILEDTPKNHVRSRCVLSSVPHCARMTIGGEADMGLGTSYQENGRDFLLPSYERRRRRALKGSGGP